jgi:hypothetical protein
MKVQPYISVVTMSSLLSMGLSYDEALEPTTQSKSQLRHEIAIDEGLQSDRKLSSYSTRERRSRHFRRGFRIGRAAKHLRGQVG